MWKIRWNIRWYLHKLIGFRGWDSPRGFKFRYWLVWAWNDYDDWLYNGIHGFRLLGAEFDTAPRWLVHLCWKILPLFRYFIRRPERDKGRSVTK